jgi:DNA-binding CsgD family transcriptional regulator
MVMVSGVEKLTQRQKEILRLVLNGFDAKSASKHLGISVHTVNEHLREARRHLGVSSSREAARILKQAESLPPNNEGPRQLGVALVNSEAPQLRRLRPNVRLAYVGVFLMILVAAAIALSIANGGESKDQVNTTATPSGAETEVPSSYASREVPLTTFNRIEVIGPFKVAVIVGKPAKVSYGGPKAMLADLIAKVDGETLIIRFPEGASWSWNPGAGVNVVVFTPRLVSARVRGAADLQIAGVHGDAFSATTEGSGTIGLRQMQVEQATFSTAGSGGITIEGSSRHVRYAVSGPGSIDAKRFKVEAASIAIDGAGSVHADVSKSASVSLSGAGRADIVGGATCIKQPSASARIECR